jgi:hypothetical protein
MIILTGLLFWTARRITADVWHLTAAAVLPVSVSGLGAILQGEPLIVARTINRNSKNFGIFFEQQRLSGPGQPYVSRQIIVSDAVCARNGHGFGDWRIGLVVVNGQFNDNLKTGISIDAGTLANGYRSPPG